MLYFIICLVADLEHLFYIFVGPKFSKCLQRIGHLARYARTDTRQVALCCINRLMQLDSRSANHAEVTKICEQWYSDLDSQPLEFLLQMSKAPFLESRLAVLQIYLSLSSHLWAQKVRPLMCIMLSYVKMLILDGTSSDI